MVKVTMWALALCVLVSSVFADSIFDKHGLGREPLPAAGMTRALGGANLATNDVNSACILAPFAAVYAKEITITGGFANVSTRSTYLDGEERTIVTMFPSLSVVVPLKGGSILTGLFEEKLGKLSLTASDTAYSIYPFTIEQTRETSIHSVPLLVATKIGKRLVVTGGFIFSFFDSRHTTSTDFASGELNDTQDTYDMSADGRAFAIGLLTDFDLITLALFYRDAVDLDGSMECQNRYAGIYSVRDFTLASHKSLAVGIRTNPLRWLELDASYYLSPWSKATLDAETITSGALERWAAGIRYTGTHLWRASKYPLLAGYYRQPMDWPHQADRCYEQVFSLGTVVPIGQDRASLALSIEIGTRDGGDLSLEEHFVGFSLSISAKEAWRREIKR